VPMRSRSWLVACALLLVGGAEAQFGRRNMGRDTGGAAPAGGGSDVDLAMAGWEQLSQNPDKMQEVIESMKDPEVLAKAQEMLKDPQYMAAAKRKMADLEAKAKANGMLDANGQPVQGAAAAAAALGMGGMGGLAGAMGGMGAAAGADAAPSEARQWELENAERHRGGTLNDAELGMANLKQALGDKDMMAKVANMMKDPATMAQVKQLMDNPAFKAQAQQMMAGLQGSGGLDMAKMAQQLQGAGIGAGLGGAGGGGGAGISEVERLRRENELLRQRLNRDEL